MKKGFFKKFTAAFLATIMIVALIPAISVSVFAASVYWNEQHKCEVPSYSSIIVEDGSIRVDAEMDDAYKGATKIESYQDKEPWIRSHWRYYPEIIDVTCGDFVAYVAVDTNGMYIYVEIEDWTIFAEDRDNDPYEGDGIQIYLDWCPTAEEEELFGGIDMKHPSPEEMYGHYIFTGYDWEIANSYRSLWGYSGMMYLGWLAGDYHNNVMGSWGFSGVHSLGMSGDKSVDYASGLTDTGWKCEWFIPWRDEAQSERIANGEQFHCSIGFQVGDDSDLYDMVDFWEDRDGDGEKETEILEKSVGIKFDQRKELGLEYYIGYTSLADLVFVNDTCTDGEPHDFSIREFIEPDCENDGYTIKKCSRCSESVECDRSAALGHEYQGGVCGRCGAHKPLLAIYDCVAGNGETFELPITIENAYGLDSLGFELYIDDEAFEFIGADFSESIFDDVEISYYDEATGVYTFHGKGIDLTADELFDGTAVVLSLKAKRDLDPGRYEFQAQVNAGRTLDANGKRVGCNSEAGAVIIVKGEAVSTIEGAMLGYGVDLSMKYYVYLDPEHAGATMRFTMNDVETITYGMATGIKNQYVYSFDGIAPQAMGDNIKAELMLGNTVLATKDNYSALEYCKNVLALTQEESGLTVSKYIKLGTLISDILDYGAKAQIYTGYKVDQLVNDGIVGQSENLSLPDTVKYVSSSKFDGVELVAAGVCFDYTNSLFVKFVANGVDSENIIITYNNSSYDIEDCELIDEETSTYYLRFDEISLMDYADAQNIAIKVYDASNGRWTVAQRLTYSVNSYIRSMLLGGSPEMEELAQALYDYSLSAIAYNAVIN